MVKVGFQPVSRIFFCFQENKWVVANPSLLPPVNSSLGSTPSLLKVVPANDFGPGLQQAVNPVAPDKTGRTGYKSTFRHIRIERKTMARIEQESSLNW
jgi:hypothetical protein